MTFNIPLRHKVPILMYHSISRFAQPKYRKLAIDPVAFADQVKYLVDENYTTLTITQFTQLIASRTTKIPERIVMLTFDDAFDDFYTDVFPLLRRHSLVATLYVPTAFVGDTSRWLWRDGEGARRLMTWDQLREVSAQGIECGAHSHHHVELDLLSPSAAAKEIINSKALLEQQLDQQIFSFAYPYGYYNAFIRGVIQQAGFSSACAVRYRRCSIEDDPFTLSRLAVTSDLSFEQFTNLVTGHSPELNVQYERLRALGWRWARKYLHQ